jgi:hypothetical protein
MIFCGPARKVTIRLGANDATSAPVCDALLAFLSPKDVCGVQVSFPESAVEIHFLARPGKVDALTNIASLIAPSALIYAEDTTIVHSTSGSRRDLMEERATWESLLRFRSAVAVEKERLNAFEGTPARSLLQRARKVSSSRGGGSSE